MGAFSKVGSNFVFEEHPKRGGKSANHGGTGSGSGVTATLEDLNIETEAGVFVGIPAIVSRLDERPSLTVPISVSVCWF